MIEPAHLGKHIAGEGGNRARDTGERRFHSDTKPGPMLARRARQRRRDPAKRLRDWTHFDRADRLGLLIKGSDYQ